MLYGTSLHSWVLLTSRASYFFLSICTRGTQLHTSLHSSNSPHQETPPSTLPGQHPLVNFPALLMLISKCKSCTFDRPSTLKTSRTREAHSVLQAHGKLPESSPIPASVVLCLNFTSNTKPRGSLDHSKGFSICRNSLLLLTEASLASVRRRRG